MQHTINYCTTVSTRSRYCHNKRAAATLSLKAVKGLQCELLPSIGKRGNACCVEIIAISDDKITVITHGGKIFAIPARSMRLAPKGTYIEWPEGVLPSMYRLYDVKGRPRRLAPAKYVKNGWVLVSHVPRDVTITHNNQSEGVRWVRIDSTDKWEHKEWPTPFDRDVKIVADGKCDVQGDDDKWRTARIIEVTPGDPVSMFTVKCDDGYPQKPLPSDTDRVASYGSTDKRPAIVEKKVPEEA
jgi:hypothetical protein